MLRRTADALVIGAAVVLAAVLTVVGLTGSEDPAVVERRSAAPGYSVTLVNASPWTFDLRVDGGDNRLWGSGRRPDGGAPLGWSRARLAPGERISGSFDRLTTMLEWAWTATLDVDGTPALTIGFVPRYRRFSCGDTEQCAKISGFGLDGAPDVGDSVSHSATLCANLACVTYRTTAEVTDLDPLTVSVRSARA